MIIKINHIKFIENKYLYHNLSYPEFPIFKTHSALLKIDQINPIKAIKLHTLLQLLLVLCLIQKKGGVEKNEQQYPNLVNGLQNHLFYLLSCE